MDIAMPDVDGIEATRRLQSLPHAPHVLILTSLSPSSTVERAVEAGVKALYRKPMLLMTLFAAFWEYAPGHHSSTQPVRNS